jgi:hypothetical protein
MEPGPEPSTYRLRDDIAERVLRTRILRRLALAVVAIAWVVWSG